MRLLLDTNVVVSAMLWGGVPHTLLQAAHEKRVTLFTSTPLLAELTDILGRRKFDKKLRHLNFQSINWLIVTLPYAHWFVPYPYQASHQTHMTTW